MHNALKFSQVFGVTSQNSLNSKRPIFGESPIFISKKHPGFFILFETDSENEHLRIFIEILLYLPTYLKY